MLRNATSVLGQMFIATQSRDGDIYEFFAHESKRFPPSIAESEEKNVPLKKV